jgi:hypothetical protein
MPVLRRVLIVVLLTLIYLLGLVTGHALAADRCVRLQVRPQVLLVRGDVDVEVHVGRHGDHRWLQIVWESDTGPSGGREIPLEGEAARPLFQWRERRWPAANYIFQATVLNAAHEVIARSDRQMIRTASVEP